MLFLFLAGMSWYVVHVGCRTGVFCTWEACHAQVDGFKGACYKKIQDKIREEAIAAFYGKTREENLDPTIVDSKRMAASSTSKDKTILV